MNKTMYRFILAALVMALGTVIAGCDTGDLGDGNPFAPTTYKAEVVPGIANGTVTLSPANAAAGTNVIITVVPDTGYKLTPGSLKINNGAVAVNGSSPQFFFTMPATNVTVTAEFEELPSGTYMVTYGTFVNGSVTGPDSAAKDATVTLTVNAAAGFRLQNNGLTVTWTTDGTSVTVNGSGNSYTFTMPEASVTVEAVFVPVPTGQYSIGIDVAVTNGVIQTNKTSSPAGEEVTLTVTPNAGYQLAAGSLTVNGSATGITGSGNTYTFVMPPAHVTVTAVFTPLLYDITIAPGIANGYVFANHENAPVGTEITLMVEPAEGYGLVAGSLTVTPAGGGTAVTITPTGTAHEYTFTMPAANVTVTAVFTAGGNPGSPYTITISGGISNGTVTAKINNTTVTTAVAGATVTLTVSPANGYALQAGSLKVNDSAAGITPSGNNYTFTMPAANVTVTAVFEPSGSTTYHITIDPAITHGTVSATHTSAAAGSPIILTLTTPDLLYGFKEGSLKVTQDGSNEEVEVEYDTYLGKYTFIMPTADVTVTAVFAPRYEVHYEAPGAGGYLPSPATLWVTEGTEITLPPQGGLLGPINSNLRRPFMGWKDNSGTDPTLYPGEGSYTVTHAVTFNAQWGWTVTYSLGGGTGTVPAKQDALEGAEIILPGQEGLTAPTGKVFAGWNINVNYLAAGASFTMIAQNVTATAQWGYTVTFDKGDGDGTAPESKVVPTDMLPLPSFPSQDGMTAPDGKVFAGWQSNIDNTIHKVGSNYSVTAPVTYTARWVTLDSIANVADYLASAPGGQLTTMVPLKVTLDLTDGTNGWTALLGAIQTAGKYVTLDLSACTSAAEFDPGSASTGKSLVTGLILPDTATSIKGTDGATTFNNFPVLLIVRGAGITTIGDYAFQECKLTEATFPEATTIGDHAFSGCTILTTVNLPKTETIGIQAFVGCITLTTANFPKAETIGDRAFYNCIELNTVALPEVKYVGEMAFYNCALTTADFPKAEIIYIQAFEGCAELTEVSFPAAEMIGIQAFNKCAELTRADLRKAKVVGDFAFTGCAKLTQVNLSAVTWIGDQAFRDTGETALTVILGSTAPGSVTVSDDEFHELGFQMFLEVSAPKTVIVKVPPNATGYGTVPETYSGADTTECWGNGFRGGGWVKDAFNKTYNGETGDPNGGASNVNTNINLTIQAISN